MKKITTSIAAAEPFQLTSWTTGLKWTIERYEDLSTEPREVLVLDRLDPGIEKAYQPLDRQDLYRRFALLGQDVLNGASINDPVVTAHFKKRLVEFVNEFGPPWICGEPGDPYPELDLPWPPVREILREARIFTLSLDISSSPAKRQPAIDGTLEMPDASHRWAWMGQQAREHTKLSLVPVRNPRGTPRVRLRYAFPSLLSMIWFQFLEELAGRTQVLCSFCKAPLPLDSRSDRVYCSESCRDAAKKRLRYHRRKMTRQR